MKRFFILTVALAAALSCGQPLLAQDSGKKASIARLKEEIKFIDNELKAASSKHKASYNQLLLLQEKSASRKKLVEESDVAIRDLNGQIYQKDLEISSLQARLDTLQQYYSNLVYNTYKNRDGRIWLMHLLSSENLGQGYRRFSYLRNLSQTMSLNAKEIMAVKDSLTQEKAQLTQMYNQAGELKREREKEYTALKSEEKKTQAVVNTLAKDKKKYKRHSSFAEILEEV